MGNYTEMFREKEQQILAVTICPLPYIELQIREGTEDNSKIIFSSPEPKAPGELIGW